MFSELPSWMELMYSGGNELSGTGGEVFSPGNPEYNFEL
jgi:hypothetical protein